MTSPWPQQATSAVSGGTLGRVGPWLAAAALHGGVAGLLALAPGAEPAVPTEPLVIEVVLLAPEPMPEPAPEPVVQRASAPDSPIPPDPAPVALPPVPEAAAPAVVPVPVPVSVPVPVPRPAAVRPTPAPTPSPALASAPVVPRAASSPTPSPALAEVAPTAAVWQGGGLANPAPLYPRSARLAGQEGRVVLRVQVAANGSVASLHVVESSGTDALDASAVRAVRDWRFRPATRAGHPVAAVVEVPVTFRLRDRLGG